MAPRHASRTIHSSAHHFGWDRSLPPATTVVSGETIEVQCLDAAGGHYHEKSTADDIARMNPERVNPVTGPILVEGAKPGDALRVTFESFDPSGFGWTANIPGFGLLADEFREPRLQLWKYDGTGRQPALFGSARVPLKPFVGTIGVAPAELGYHSIIPPTRVAGNLDVRDLAIGTRIFLPVEVEGALLSIGDTHAAQGDGEVCGTAIETAMKVVVTIDVQRGKAPPYPRFQTPGPVSRHLDFGGYDVTTGIGPDLSTAARDSVRTMIDLLVSRHKIAPVDAYMLCSVCGDLRISEIVNRPNWVVSFYFPRCVFD
jgi:acetamidase/formamidase